MKEAYYLSVFLETLTIEEIRLFKEIFSDISYEVEELGYTGSESELVFDMLLQHFGIALNDGDLEILTEFIIKKEDLCEAVDNYIRDLLWGKAA